MTNREEKRAGDSYIRNNMVYGKYSMGFSPPITNQNKVYDRIDDPEVVNYYVSQISRDIERSGISSYELKNWNILDCGTGRQAIAFNLLGANRIQHYDISRHNVERLQSFIDSKSLQDQIATECVDLVNYQPPKNSFDLVYLHGIVHHFSHTGIGLRNCMEAVKGGGYLWLYFYRSGTLKKYVYYLLRDLIQLIDNIDQREWFINAIILHSEKCQPDGFVSSLMDNLFVNYFNLYPPKSYLEFISECGFEVSFSSKLDPIGKDVDHKYAHESVIQSWSGKTGQVHKW